MVEIRNTKNTKPEIGHRHDDSEFQKYIFGGQREGFAVFHRCGSLNTKRGLGNTGTLGRGGLKTLLLVVFRSTCDMEETIQKTGWFGITISLYTCLFPVILNTGVLVEAAHDIFHLFR